MRSPDAGDLERAKRQHRALFVITTPAAIILVVGIVLTAGFTSWNYARLRDGALEAVRETEQRDVARNRRTSDLEDYNLCVAISDNADTLSRVIATSYMATSGEINPAELPAGTRELLADLEPLLQLLQRQAARNQKIVQAQVHDPPECVRPAGAPGSAPVVRPTSPPTSLAGSSSSSAGG